MNSNFYQRHSFLLLLIFPHFFPLPFIVVVVMTWGDTYTRLWSLPGVIQLHSQCLHMCPWWLEPPCSAATHVVVVIYT